MKNKDERIKLENKKKKAREVFIKEKITEGFKLSLNPKTLTKKNHKFEEKYILQDKYIIENKEVWLDESIINIMASYKKIIL